MLLLQLTWGAWIMHTSPLKPAGPAVLFFSLIITHQHAADAVHGTAT